MFKCHLALRKMIGRDLSLPYCPRDEPGCGYQRPDPASLAQASCLTQPTTGLLPYASPHLDTLDPQTPLQMASSEHWSEERHAGQQ